MLREPNGKIASDCGLRTEEPTKGMSVGSVYPSAVQERIIPEQEP